ncbi:hypothetical protein MSAN_00779200 [Mycena sanguinolenta]|uniref:Uncharacterized protein n=1 Tax=Mycena sanguinolenta TaxID=230812 RepID=A0A8H7DDG4_9AGAR|nr:hypothetical protein MSAN_00779200 [Mycena sanguinolenta]
MQADLSLLSREAENDRSHQSLSLQTMKTAQPKQSLINTSTAVKEEAGVKEISMEAVEASAKAQPFIMKQNISP